MTDFNLFNDIFDKIVGWLEEFILLFPNLVAALLVLILSLIIARFARRRGRRLINSFSAQLQVNNLFANLVYLTILAAGLFIALSILGLNDTVATLLAGVGILGLALGFAFQDIAENFIAGVMMAFSRPMEVGDIVETNDFFGTVEEVNLRSTIIRTPQGQHVLIPNSEVFSNPLKNYSRTADQRIDLTCGISYADDLEKAERLTIETIEGLSVRDKNREVEMYFEEFGDSSINFVLRFWIQYEAQRDFLAARSAAIKAIKQAFDENGITIPFPIRTLDFGIEGGVSLDEMLPHADELRG